MHVKLNYIFVCNICLNLSILHSKCLAENVLMLMDKKQFEFNNGTIKLGPCFFQLTVKDFREG